MSPLSRKVWFAAVLLGPILWPAAATRAAAPDDDTSPPRIKPLAERHISIAPWEVNSAGPGNVRFGGDDERGFAFSPDGSLLAGADGGGWQVELWDVASGKSLGQFGRFYMPSGLAFRPDGKALLVADQNLEGSVVELWDAGSQKLLRKLDEDVNVVLFTASAFTPDGKTLVLGGADRRGNGGPMIHLWDVPTGDELRRFPGPAAPEAVSIFHDPPKAFNCLCCSPDGRSLALVADHRIGLWELASGKERCLLGELPIVAHPEGIGAASSIAFSPDGRILAVGGADGAVHLWDVAGERECPPLVGHKGGVRAVAFARDGKTLWSLGQNGDVLTWPTTGPWRDWRPGKPSEASLAAAWNDLASDDALTRYAAEQTLAAAPQQALPILRGRLHPVAKADAARAAQLATALSNEDFNERKKAIIELRKLGELALPALRAGFNGAGPSRQIIQRIMRQMDGQYPTAEQVQACRGVAVLGRIGGDEARKLLTELADGAPEALLTRQAKATLENLPDAAPTADVGMEKRWDDLASDDAKRAYQAIRALASQSDKATPLLRERLRRTAAETDDDPARVARLIADLGADDFDARQKASTELARLGRAVEPALRKALEAGSDAEAKRRLQELLNGMKVDWPPERLQVERALEALEQIGGDEARQALEAIARDARNHWLKERIADSLHRLNP